MYPNFFCNFFLPNILFSIFHVFKRIHWLKLNCLHMHECGVICWVMSNLLVIFLKRKNDSPSNSSWWCRRLLNQGWDFISSSHMSAEISRDSLLCKSREGFLSFFEYNSHTMSRKQHFATLYPFVLEFFLAHSMMFIEPWWWGREGNTDVPFSAEH